MNLCEAFRNECIRIGATFADKDAALSAIAELACQTPAMRNVDIATVLAGLKERETLGSTGFGGGIAIPHCRLEGIDDFAVGLVTVPDGVEFDTIDGKPVKLLVFIIAPARETNEHVRVLAAVSQVLSQAGAIDEILAAQSVKAAEESFLRRVRDEVSSDYRGRSLFHVFVQDDSIFRPLLQAIVGVGSTPAVVIEARNLHTYLAKVPLFAGLWHDDAAAVSRMIVATTDKKLTNETIRCIEQVTGPLDVRKDVLVTVQDIFFSAGSLES